MLPMVSKMFDRDVVPFSAGQTPRYSDQRKVVVYAEDAEIEHHMMVWAKTKNVLRLIGAIVRLT
ncbi:hypothetical protein AC244_16235 [Ensifer adhaerens]|uniref:Uncharacterized protein n=1 Tax=Ensifer adhaerens TaxID=106592 RepID=A0A0L8BT49_ENSAD|nr:hypothetical protein AC244_16235 [Ensifer adhaerens]